MALHATRLVWATDGRLPLRTAVGGRRSGWSHSWRRPAGTTARRWPGWRVAVLGAEPPCRGNLLGGGAFAVRSRLDLGGGPRRWRVMIEWSEGSTVGRETVAGVCCDLG